MMKGHSVLHCVVWEKKVSPTGCRIGNAASVAKIPEKQTVLFI